MYLIVISGLRGPTKISEVLKPHPLITSILDTNIYIKIHNTLTIFCS